MIPSDEEDALKRILRKHDVSVTRALVEDLSTFTQWVHDSDYAKIHFATQPPVPWLITVLSKMGIHGKSYIDKVEVQPRG